MLDKQQRKRIISRHRDSLTRYGHHPHALYWSGKDIQEIRFQVLTEVGIQDGDSVLDVGCGFGDFYAWIKQKGIAIDYTGVDLSPDLVAKGREIYPDIKLIVGELFDCRFSQASFDWVILSGAMNEPLHDDASYAKKMITLMYDLCVKGVAFNMLDARFVQAHDLQSVYPQAMLEYCESIASSCILKDDYLKNDFSIYMLR